MFDPGRVHGHCGHVVMTSGQSNQNFAVAQISTALSGACLYFHASVNKHPNLRVSAELHTVDGKLSLPQTHTNMER